MPKNRKLAVRIVSSIACVLFFVTCFSFSGNCVTYETSSNYDSSIFHQRLLDTALTGNPRVDLINIALSQYGYSEGNNNWQLSGMEIGIGNHTEYGRWYGVQSMWCAMFVSWCAAQANIPDMVIPSHAYTVSGVLWFMDNTKVHSREEVEEGSYIPQAGDIIYFRSDRNESLVNHVGIVLGFFDGYLYTIEGNINFDPYCTDGGQVLLRNRHISDPYIRYFCCPKYNSDETHTISTFFPKSSERPVAAEAEITVSPPADNTVDTPDSVSTSEKSQYHFIP